MFCKNCGSNLSDQAAFCPNCGTKLQEPAQQSQPAAQNHQPQQPAYNYYPQQSAPARPAMNINTNPTAILSYIAAGCSAVAAILWGFIGVTKYSTSISMYEMYLEPSHLTFLTVFIIMALSVSAIFLVLPQLGVLNSNILSKKSALTTAAITTLIVNVFTFFIFNGFLDVINAKGLEFGDTNAVTYLFFILSWAGLVLTFVVFNKSRKEKK